MTPGNFSSPMLYIKPMAQLIRPIMTMEKIAKSQNGPLTSFFWHAAPPQDVVMVDMPSSPTRTTVSTQAQAKHCADFWEQDPWPEQLFVADSQVSMDV